jgi:TolB-like protein/DNA-binding winged helix-turn-helix (wHTH) protein/tetratricopeptide (TPR) repeat protein
MEDLSSARTLVRFGAFELDQDAGELRKQGAKIRLQEQPLQVLQILLKQPGKVITREELQRRIWPSDTFVDFDHGINNAIKRLREALGDTAETPRYIETLPRRGYRFIGILNPVADPSLRAIRSVVVLPLEDLSGDAEQEYFADGLTEALITSLAKIRALRVVSRTTAMQYKKPNRSLPDIARDLHVDGVVEGTVLRSGDRVRISAQLIDARTDSHVWAESYDRDLRDILAVHSELARSIAGQIQITFTPGEQRQLGRGRPVDPEAYEAYLKGRHHWNRRSADDLKKAINYFQHAIEKEPNYAPAHTGLADCAGIAGFWSFAPPAEGCRKAKAAALKSLEIEETAEARASLGWAVLHYDWDLSAAEREFQRAIEENPLYATAHQWYGHCLGCMGRFEEAFAELGRAIELEPLSLIISTSYAGVSWLGRQWDQAIEQTKKTLDLDPSFAPGLFACARSYDCKGVPESAIAYAQEAVKLSHSTQLFFIADLGHAYASAGKKEEAMDVLQQLKEIGDHRYVDPCLTAHIHVALGEKESAFECLDRACETRAAWVPYLAMDPWFDPLRHNPKFEDLLQRAGLPFRPRLSNRERSSSVA